MERGFVLLGIFLLLFSLSACSGVDNQATAASVSAVATVTGDEDLSGSYSAVEGQEELILTIAGSSGLLTRQLSNGSRRTQQVKINAQSDTMTIGKDKTSYRLQDDGLLITEIEKSDLFKGGFLLFSSK